MTAFARRDLSPLKSGSHLFELVTARLEIDKRRSRRNDLWAVCPFHAEKTASFHVFRGARGEERFKCFGCGAAGDVLEFLMRYERVDFKMALALLGVPTPNSLPQGEGVRRSEMPALQRGREAAARAQEGLRRAQKIWDEAEAFDPLLDAYLAARGIDVAALRRGFAGSLPDSLRFHPALECREAGLLVHKGPAMVARIERSGDSAREFIGVHRTWIAATGRARTKGGEKVPKQWLGLTGRMGGGAISFGRTTKLQIVGEGIETVLAVFSRLIAAGRARPDLGEGWSAEAALSLGNLAGAGEERFAGPLSRASGKPLPSAMPDWTRPGWRASDEVDELVILGEGSAKDPQAAQRFALRARRRHAVKSCGAPRRARLWVAGGDYALGLDHADLAAGAILPHTEEI